MSTCSPAEHCSGPGAQAEFRESGTSFDAHAMHSDDDGWATVLFAHAKHTATDEAPGVAEYLPAAQEPEQPSGLVSPV